LVIGLPFNLGQLEFEPDEIQQMAAWELYVELATRIAVRPFGADEGLMREALSSLYSIFGTTRDVLRQVRRVGILSHLFDATIIHSYE
jgi:hypothetical protein